MCTIYQVNSFSQHTRSPKKGTEVTVSSRIAAALFAVWGLLHIGLGVVMLLNVDPASIALSDLAAESMMFFVCAIIFGCQAVGVATTLNWRNRPAGLWLNGVVLGAVDIVFVFVMVLPGHTDIAGGLAGPTIWAIATGFAIAARRSASRHRSPLLTQAYEASGS